MKLEMAVLWQGGSWETQIVEVPDSFEGKSYHELDDAGRSAIYAEDKFDDCAGCYLFSYGSWLDDPEEEDK